MPRRFLKSVLPKQDDIQKHKSFKRFGNLLRLHYLWHLNRQSVSRGVAIGMFWAFIPIPFQMVPATFFAILFRGNLLVSVALVWITNPVTMPPIFYFSYRLGRLILGKSVSGSQVTPDILWFLEKINEIWWPLLTGSLVIGITLSVLGHLIINQFWRYRIIYAWIKRREKYKAKKR